MKKVLFFCAIALCVGFASCSDNDADDFEKTDGVSTFTMGGFLLNEGNYGTNGHLAYINRKTGAYTDSVYYKVNGKMLGNIAQAMTFANGKVYIVSQKCENNGSEGLIVIADATTLKRIKSISPAALAEKNPDQISVLGEDMYVHSTTYGENYTSIYALYRIQPDGKIITIAGGEDITNLPMVVYNGKIYAASKNKEIIVIEAGKIIKKIAVAGTPTGIQIDNYGKLWVSTEGDFQGITRIDIRNLDNPVATQHKLEQPIGRGYAHAPAFGVIRNKVYFCNGTSTIYKHDFTNNQTSKMVDVTTFNPNATINYNGVSVDPISGDVYYSGIKSFEQWQQNATFVFSDSGVGLVKKWEFVNKNAFPAGMFFNSSF